jgi:hypothetical protein
MKNAPIATRWEGTDLVVSRDAAEVDRLRGADIRRVILVCEGGDTPSELQYAVIETATEHVLLPAASGIAARVYFERQLYWTQRACIYWVTGRHTPLPRHLCTGVWLLRRNRPAYMRLPVSELAALLAQWPLEGPQTWEQRKWANIAVTRSLAELSHAGMQTP